MARVYEKMLLLITKGSIVRVENVIFVYTFRAKKKTYDDQTVLQIGKMTRIFTDEKKNLFVN